MAFSASGIHLSIHPWITDLLSPWLAQNSTNAALQRRERRAGDARVEPPRPAKTAAVRFTFGVSDMRAPQINQRYLRLTR